MDFKNKIENIIGKQNLGLALILFSAICFSSKGVLIKVMFVEKADYLTVLAFRMLFSSPFYLIVLFNPLKKNETRLPKKSDILIISFLGVVGYYLSSLFDFAGLQYINANLERLILFVYPSFVVILSALYFKMKTNKFIIFSLIVTYLGVLLVLGYDFKVSGNQVLIGGGLVLCSAITYAIYLVFSDGLIKKYGSIIFTSWIMIISSICILSHYFFIHEFNDIFNQSAKFYYLSIVLAIFCTLLPSYAVSAGIKLIGSGNSAITATLGPIWTLFLAYFILGETITLIQIIGTGFVIYGISLSRKGK